MLYPCTCACMCARERAVKGFPVQLGLRWHRAVNTGKRVLQEVTNECARPRSARRYVKKVCAWRRLANTFDPSRWIMVLKTNVTQSPPARS